MTPKSYLDSIQLYQETLKQVEQEHNDYVNRLRLGVQKLEQTNHQIDALKIALAELRPQLIEKAKQAEV